MPTHTTHTPPQPTAPAASPSNSSCPSCASCASRCHPAAPSSSSAPSAPSAVSSSTLPPRERAFALYCQGQRSPAIAATLGVPERTVRLWISDTLRKLTEENAAQRRDHQTLAIARYEAISNAAWEGYARAAALEQATLQSTLAALTTPSVGASTERPPAEHTPQSPAESATPSSSPSSSVCSVCSVCSVVNSSDPSAPSAPSASSAVSPSVCSVNSVVNPPVLPSCPPSPFVPSVLKSPSPGARYLAVAMAADREISRLQGLYLPEATKPQNDVHIILERREPTAENYPPGEYPSVPDHAATPPDPTRAGGFCDGTPLGADSSASSPTATPADALTPAPDSPAESASFSSAPSSSVSSASSVSSVVNPSATSAVQPSVIPTVDPPIPGLPLFRERNRHSPYHISRLANRGYGGFRWP